MTHRSPRGPRLAFDRSSRSYDPDGHLRVANNVLTSVGVSPYLGHEIPDYTRLGLRPDRIYQLLRPAAELRRAAPSLAGKPLLLRHVEITANAHAHDDVCGAVGSDVEFDGTVIRSSLIIWTADAIAGIEGGDCRSLSCGYYYVPDMTPGTFQGTAYDGVMKSIQYNHVAVVAEPRVPGSMVGDSMPSFDPDDDVPQVTTVKDPHSALCLWARERLDPDDVATFEGLVEQLMEWASDPDGWAGDARTRRRKYAGDKAMISRDTVRAIQEIEAAKQAVAPYIGPVNLAFDSVGAVYVHALAQLGHDVTELRAHQHTIIPERVWDALPGSKKLAQRRTAAMDAKSVASRSSMFPNGNRLLSGY